MSYELSGADQRLASLKGKAILVTGGSGYVGRCLCRMLVQCGAKTVRSLDVKSPRRDDRVSGVEYYEGDVRDPEVLAWAARGGKAAGNSVSCIVHMASWGMSGAEMADFDATVEAVNVGGTRAALEACTRLGVPALVYTSTYNVVFGGQPIVDGDETLPYFPLEQHEDSYSRTKAIAEELVLQASTPATKLHRKATRLRTCAIRPAAIYGEGEDRHFPRIVRMAKWGLFVCVGKRSDLVDWVHGDNVAYAHALAAAALLSEDEDERHSVTGQVFFISDGNPINNFEFLRPLIEGLGYSFPRFFIPVAAVMPIARAFKFACKYSPVRFTPLLLPAEVYKVGITHYFRIDKARKLLGYAPLVSPEDGMRRTVTNWQVRQIFMFEPASWYFWVSAAVGLGLFYYMTLTVLATAPEWVQTASTRLLQFLVMLHIVQGWMAYTMAGKFQASNALWWALQTFFVGAPALNMLRRKEKLCDALTEVAKRS